MDTEQLAREVVDCAFKLHCELGPGLFESVYETILSKSLKERGFAVERQKSVAFTFDGMKFDEGFRVDLLIEGKLPVELKSVETTAPVHVKQLLTYLRLLKLPLGLLINFGAATFKEGIVRVVNNHTDVASSRLRIHE
jgi:GxxExxY protein